MILNIIFIIFLILGIIGFISLLLGSLFYTKTWDINIDEFWSKVIMYIGVAMVGISIMILFLIIGLIIGKNQCKNNYYLSENNVYKKLEIFSVLAMSLYYDDIKKFYKGNNYRNYESSIDFFFVENDEIRNPPPVDDESILNDDKLIFIWGLFKKYIDIRFDLNDIINNLDYSIECFKYIKKNGFNNIKCNKEIFTENKEFILFKYNLNPNNFSDSISRNLINIIRVYLKLYENLSKLNARKLIPSRIYSKINFRIYKIISLLDDISTKYISIDFSPERYELSVYLLKEYLKLNEEGRSNFYILLSSYSGKLDQKEQNYITLNLENWLNNGPPDKNYKNTDIYDEKIKDEVEKYNECVKIILKLIKQHPEIKTKLYSLHEKYVEYKHPTRILHANGIIFD